jgi:hypothetical protein
MPALNANANANANTNNHAVGDKMYCRMFLTHPTVLWIRAQ